MNELEQRLRSARLAAPSADLDRHLDEVFLAARRKAQGARPAAWYWWLTAAAAVGGMAALFLLASHRFPPAPDAVVYRFEAQGRMVQMLLNPTARRAEPPSFVIRAGPP